MTNCNIFGIAGKLGQPASTGRGQPSVLAWQQKTSAFCFLQTSPLCQCAMEGGSIETRVIIDPPNGNTNTEGKAKVNCSPASSAMVSKIIIICLILRISPPLTSLKSGWSIPGPRSTWVSLWDDEGWQQRTQSFKVKSADYKTV